MISFARAKWLALLLPAALMAGALGSQYIGGLFPCEMCFWQRWPHYTAIILAALAFIVKSPLAQRLLVALAALAILSSGVIGFFHAGVEYGWWPGITGCAVMAHGSIADIVAAPPVSCDQAQWRFLGISLAGYNGIISSLGAIAVLTGLRKSAA